MLGQVVSSKLTISPMKVDNGIFWAKNGFHYLNQTDVQKRIDKLDQPAESEMEARVSASTPTCDGVENGFCQRGRNDYVTQTLVAPAVQYTPGTPDSKKVVGYCTLCNDGTYSPSCAVGRGACSHHSGVQAYDVPEYVTVPGTAATQAQPATYSYSSKTYVDSPNYQAPPTPSMASIIAN